MTAARAPRLYVLAGVNGAGKSSVGGAAFRASGADYYNPDEAAHALLAASRGLGQAEANGMAWAQGTRLLRQAIAERLDFAFETTLGGSTITRLLVEAASQGIEVYLWYAGLSGPDLHIERVRNRVRKGGHDIPEPDIRRRYDHSRLNLIHLLPSLAALRIFDNSAEADPDSGRAPLPRLVLHMQGGRIVGPEDLPETPDWARPIVAAALALHLR